MKPALLSFGEILWDVVGETEHIGGAPLNLAAHAARLGLRPHLYSRVGRDERGRRAREIVRGFGVGDRWLSEDTERPTGWVDVALDGRGEPSYSMPAGVAWDAIPVPDGETIKEIERAEIAALYFGTLSQRGEVSRAALAGLRRALPRALVFYDVNLRPPYTNLDLVRESLAEVGILKVNHEELPVLGEYFWGRAFEAGSAFERWHAEFGVKLLLVTMAGGGCLAIAPGETVRVPGIPTKVVSAVGAGDAFSAAFLAGRLAGRSMRACAEMANRLGGLVASSPEAVPLYDADALGVTG